MSQIRFLFDENIDPDLAQALHEREAAIEFILVGDHDDVPLGSPDPVLLEFAEENRLALVSSDRKTLPVHFREHLDRGRHTFGLFLLRRKATWAKLIDDLLLIWSGSEAEEWRDQIERIPWK